MVETRIQAVIQRANANRAVFEDFCRSLTAEELGQAVPETPWCVKDYIAHLASIDIYVADWFEHVIRAERFRPSNPDGTPFNIDTWNQTMVDDRAEAAVEELLTEAAAHRSRLWKAVEAMPAEVRESSFNFRGNQTSYVRYLELWTAHDPAHTVDMLRGLPGGRRDAVDSWLREHRM